MIKSDSLLSKYEFLQVKRRIRREEWIAILKMIKKI